MEDEELHCMLNEIWRVTWAVRCGLYKYLELIVAGDFN